MEALVILLVPLVAAMVWAVAFFQPRSLDRREEQSRLDQHISWLEDRLQHAKQKNWDEHMVGRLADQLETARREQRALVRG